MTFNWNIFLCSYFVNLREREGGEREKSSICCSVYWCIYWLIIVCALTGDWTHNFGILGQCSNQLSYPARVFLCSPPPFFLLRFYLFILRGREGDREGENMSVWFPLALPPLGTWPVTQACTLTGNWTSNPLVHRLALNPLSHTNQGPL